MISCLLRRSTRAGKKFQVVVHDPSSGRTRTVHFGAEGYSDYPTHKDAARLTRYLERHHARENWSRQGIYSPGFWARWILWNRPSLSASIRDTARRFQLRIVTEV